jgi:cell division protease FtsH
MTVVTPPAPPDGAPCGTVPAGPSVSRPAADPRFPWKARGTRKPAGWWDRTKFFYLIGLLLGLLAWNEYLRIRPVGSVLDAVEQVAAQQPWLLWLAGAELVRQLHFFIGERSARYNRLWAERIFGGWNRWFERRFNPWNRYRITRVVKWLFWVSIGAVVVGKVTNASPVVALFKAPALALAAAPMAFQIVFIVALSVLQFAAIFWFMARGGVETYFPDDIETRFSDVWGQDHVVGRIKENMVLLEDPESIEAKGGHVPSGILLWGPPGTGKTLMAEAVAGETGKPYVFVDPGAFQNMFFGVGILKVKGLFRKLRKLALRYGGVIVFFDEADSLGSRGGVVGGGAGGYATPAPWDANGCNGFGHLSGHGRRLVLQSTLGTSAMDGDPSAGRGWRDRVVGMPMNQGMGGGGMGTLQALLTELSGLKKPRGFLNRVVRRTLGMKPKPPPKFRILVMMATNLPDALDPALLRPGRIDQKFRVGYPSKEGRLRTYEGYLAKVTHELTPEQVDKLATITPYATGASIKDLVNNALINAIREKREVITWKDVIKAKHLNELGPSEDVEYIERERHAVAVHEACHAVLAWQTRRHMEIDLATIEKGSTYLGMVASIPPEEQFTRWRSEYESDILVSLASLAGERLFYGGDNSSGVSGDLRSATTIAALMESHWGMGEGISSLPALQDFGIHSADPADRRKRGGGGIGFGAELGAKKEDLSGGALGQRIETGLARYLADAEEMLRARRGGVLALAHALESHKTLTGEDVVAVLEGRQGPLVDGRPYADPQFVAELERYHESAVEAHRRHSPVQVRLPKVTTIHGELIEEGPVDDVRRVAASAGWALGATEAPAPAPAPGPGQAADPRGGSD